MNQIEDVYLRFFDWLLDFLKDVLLLSPVAVVVIVLGALAVWLLCLFGDWLEGMKK